MRLLIVEDNERLASVVAERLGARGFGVDTVADLKSADAALDSCSYDGVILDLGLPDGDGLEWLKARRTGGEAPPTLILTARTALDDRVAGLDAGADDYLVKPFELDELAARLRALLRRPGRRESPMLQHGSVRFDTATREGSFEGEDLALARREADLLETLMRRAGTVVTRASLEQTLYSGEDDITPNALEASASRLRRKLEQAGGGDYLHTIRGVGYMLRQTA